MTKKSVLGNPNDDERGSTENSVGPRFLLVGQVRKPHGIRGDVLVTSHTDIPERFSWIETIYLGMENPRPVEVEKARLHKGVVLLKLVGYDDRDAADTLRNEWLQIPESEAVPLEEGEYYLYQLEGLQVVTDEGESLGVLVDVIETKANNVFVVNGDRGEVLLPDIDDVILEIDFDKSQILVHLIPGLLPD